MHIFSFIVGALGISHFLGLQSTPAARRPRAHGARFLAGMRIISLARAEGLGRLFKEASLEVRSKNDLKTAAKMNGATLSIVDCRPLDKEAMVLLLELSGTSNAVRKTILTVRGMIGIRQSQVVEGDSARTRLLAVVDKPRICQASEDHSILCLDCPFNSTEIPARWRFVTRRTSDPGQIVSRLADEGIQARIRDIKPLEKSATFSEKERGILSVAIEKGYFDFPRRITLKDLSELVGVDPASLSAIFQRME